MVPRRSLISRLLVLAVAAAAPAGSALSTNSLYVAEFHATPSSYASLDDESHDQEFWKQLRFAKFWRDDHGQLRGAMSQPDAFRGHLQRDSEHGVLMLIHGYNTDVEDAVKWAPDLVRRLGSEATPLLFRWTSAGRLLAFDRDKFYAFGSGPGLSILLRHLQPFERGAAPKPVDLVAFSMGNLVLARGLVSMPHGALRHVILLAPAVDEDLARDVAIWGTRPTGTTTVYVSGQDLALWWARRIGERPPNPRTSRLGSWDIVDVSGVCTPSLLERLRLLSKIQKSHYYFSCDLVARDARLALSGASPQSRGLQRTSTGWRIRLPVR